MSPLMSSFSFNEAGLSKAAMDKACAAGSWRPPTAFISLDPREAKSAMIKDSEEAILIETGRMAARLIHDFKNQLGGLKLYAAYMQKRFADNAEGVEVAEKIAQGLNEMAEQAVIKLGPRASAKRVKISCDLEPGAPQVSLDSRQIGEALEAIISRAVDASPEDGEIGISLRRRDGTPRIEIKDNGATLNDERRLNLFDPLSGDRLNRTALGLAMARRIIERHGGEVSARAGASAGTIVEVTLPIADCGLRIAD